MSDKKDRDFFDYLQWIFTAIIGLGTLWISIQQYYIKEDQSKINLRIQRENIAQTFAEKVYGYIENLKIGDEAKDDVLIELLDIITEANIQEIDGSSGEQKAEYKNQRLLMPLRLALITGNDEILTHITTNDEKRKLWVNFALKSSNEAVRSTAIRALGRIGMHGSKEGIESDLHYSIRNILELISRDYKTKQAAFSTITEIITEIGVIKIDQDPDLAKILSQNSKTLIDIGIELHKLYATRTKTGDKEDKKIEEKANQTVIGISTIQSINLEAYEKKTISSGTVISDGNEIDALIEDLISEIPEERRDARNNLADKGNNAVKKLLKALDNKSYRTRLGVSYSLYKMRQPVIIEESYEIKSLVDLIGDEKAEIRKYCSEFLMKLYEKKTVENVYKQLKEILKTDRKNGNKLYNSVVILGTWMRILPGEHKTKKQQISQDLKELGDELAPNAQDWKRTLRLIDELQLASKS